MYPDSVMGFSVLDGWPQRYRGHNSALVTGNVVIIIVVDVGCWYKRWK